MFFFFPCDLLFPPDFAMAEKCGTMPFLAGYPDPGGLAIKRGFLAFKCSFL